MERIIIVSVELRMFFPVSGVEVYPMIPPLVAFGVSFFTSMGGISGAFLLLPFQMSVLGYTHPSVSATNQFFNVVAIPAGICGYIREKRMVWPLAVVVAAGTLPGVFIGAYTHVVWLPARPFKLFSAVILLYIGGYLVRDLLTKKSSKPGASELRGIVNSAPGPDFTIEIQELSLKNIRYTFHEESYRAPVSGVFLLSFITGIVGGIYGIGGGAIIAPFLMSLFRLPVHTISGATLMGTFLTSIAGVIFYIMLAPFFPEQCVAPDWTLGLLFGVGGMAGMNLGAHCQKFVPATAIKWMIGSVTVGTAIKYILEFFG